MIRKRVLILRPLGLGDFLTAVPAYRAIARAFPEHERILLAPASLEPLAGMTGAIHRVLDTRPLEPLSTDCRDADVAVDLHGRGPASQRILLAANPHRLIAFANDAVRETRGFPRWSDDEHEVQRWCRLLSESDIPADPSELDLRNTELASPRNLTGQIVIHPGAAYPARRWPGDRWAAVIRAIGPDQVVITGDQSEWDLAMSVAQQAGVKPSRVLAGTTDLRQLTAVLAGARLLVSGDTGIAHLATALRTPSVLLFGPTSPAQWGPPQRSIHRVLWAGRRGDPHGDRPDPGLLEISVSDVLNAINSLNLVQLGVPA